MRAETRHSLKQDKFNKVTIGAAGATFEWSAEHKGTLLVAGVIALVVIAAIIGGWYYTNQRNEAASLNIEQGVRTLETPVRPAGVPAQPEFPTFASDMERATMARKQFQAVVDTYPHTHSADIARYFVAVTDATMGNSAVAEREFKEAAAQGDKDVSALAEYALASLYRSSDRTKDAIDIYKKLIDKPSDAVGKPMAQMALAETYQAAGQTAEAKVILEQVQKENPVPSEIGRLASQKLGEVK